MKLPYFKYLQYYNRHTGESNLIAIPARIKIKSDELKEFWFKITRSEAEHKFGVNQVIYARQKADLDWNIYTNGDEILESITKHNV